MDPAAFEATAFSVTAFSPTAFDFSADIGPTPDTGGSFRRRQIGVLKKLGHSLLQPVG